jgi:ubiquinone/menaquinone biosynthesis C-methylase UbiE
MRTRIVTNNHKDNNFPRGRQFLRAGAGQARSAIPGPRALSVTEGYELWAPSYDQDPNPLLALEERTLDGLLPSLAGKDVIDIGCGTGRWLQRFLNSGARSATGVDLSPAMLAAARPKPGLKERLVGADCLALPFHPGAADFVMCSFVTGHIPDLEVFANELARVTRPGADCYVIDVHPAAHLRGWRTGFRHANGSAEIATFSRSFAQIRESMAAQGFTLTRSFEPRLGEPERPIFARAGKEQVFEQVAGVAALLICHFTRLDSDEAA